jgi:hypothetical protein
MATSVENSAWLQWMATLMGGVSRQAYAATLPPDHFHCLVDDLPLHLIPRRALSLLGVRGDRSPSLVFNPECTLCSGGETPEQFADNRQLLSGFAQEGTVAWVRNPLNETCNPFWLGPQSERVLRELHPGEPALAVPPELSTLLMAADIFISEGEIERRRRERDDMIRRSGRMFREKGYAPLENLIHPFHVAALRRYYRYLIRTGAIKLGDGQSPRRYVAYNEPVARFFHYQMTATLSAVAGEPLKPSYVYMASYLSGADLKKHTDRAQCEFSVTLCLDFSPEPAGETPWPIQLDTAAGAVSVYQALGDGLAYRGTRLPHYRDVLGEGQTSTSIFFHYVPADFQGSLG